jgi:DnaK suppressor protein
MSFVGAIGARWASTDSARPIKEAVMTGRALTIHDQLEQLRNALEEQFQRHTSQLAELIVCSRQPDRGGYDDDTLTGLIASSRQAIADTAEALRRMAEGSYGRCEHCTADIPAERLEILPHARLCVPCQRTQTG